MRPWICQSCRCRQRKPQGLDAPPNQLTIRTNSSNARRARRQALREDESRKQPASDLPRPPFMRPRLIEPDRFDWVPYTRGPPQYNNKKTRLVRLEAPFATAFAENPYAQALMTPVRECTFTGARMPRSLLMDFHVVDEDDPVGAGSLAGQLQMLPLSLAAQLVPRKKKPERQTGEEREAVRRWDEEKDNNEPSRASYVVMRKGALDFVSARPGKRVLSHAMSARMQLTLGKERRRDKVQWRQDMPAIVLEGLRRVLWKRLDFFMRSKGRADKESLVQALSADYGLRSAHDVDNLGCVLRLTEREDEEPVKTESPVATRYALRQQGSGAADAAEDRKVPWAQSQEATAQSDTAEEAEDTAEPEESDEAMPEEDDEPSLRSRPEQLVQNLEVEDAKADNAEPGDAEVENTAVQAEEQLGSETWQEHGGKWSARQTKVAPFLDGIRPLAPPHQPMQLYFPTVRYRNQRVPVYSLPQLLGEKYTARLVEDTVFASGVDYVAVKFAPGTMELQQLLLKLHAFFAEGKDEAAKI